MRHNRYSVICFFHSHCLATSTFFSLALVSNKDFSCLILSISLASLCCCCYIRKLVRKIPIRFWILLLLALTESLLFSLKELTDYLCGKIREIPLARVCYTHISTVSSFNLIRHYVIELFPSTLRPVLVYTLAFVSSTNITLLFFCCCCCSDDT
jgi:hypothetical protein